jgi:hypothetical protein
MGHTHQPPLTTDAGQAAQQEPTDTPSFFALTTHWFHDALAPRVYGTPCRCPPCRRQPLLRGGEPGRALGLQAMVSWTLRCQVRITPQVLHSGSRSRAVRAALRGGRHFLYGARGVRGGRPAGLRQGRPRQRRQGRRLLFVVRRSGDVTRHDDWVSRIATRLGIAAILPAFGVGPPAVQLGTGDIGLRCVVWRLVHGFGRFAAPRAA